MVEVEILDSAQQASIIRETTSLSLYQDFISKFFKDPEADDYHPNLVKVIKPNVSARLSPDYFRLATLVAVMGTQFSFESMSGQFARPIKKSWSGSPLNPVHLVGLGQYIGAINRDSHVLKGMWEAQLQIEEPEISQGVWGISMGALAGSVKGKGRETIEQVKNDSRLRLFDFDRRPICLPTPCLNQAFQELPFTGDNASDMSDGNFEVFNSAYPRIKAILEPYLDADEVFGKHCLTSLPEYMPSEIESHISPRSRGYYL